MPTMPPVDRFPERDEVSRKLFDTMLDIFNDTRGRAPGTEGERNKIEAAKVIMSILNK